MASHKPTVFISHVGSDADLANRLARALAELGLDVQSDAIIPPGDQWVEAIEASLERANLVLLLVSPAFLSSPSANFEAGIAVGREIPDRRVIPIMLQGVTPDALPYRLRRLQGVVASDIHADVPTLIRQLSPVLDSLRHPTASRRA